MDDKIVFSVIGLCLVLAGVAGYCYFQMVTLQTQVNSLTWEIDNVHARTLYGKIIKIGYISPSNIDLETVKPYLEQIIAPDMNAYCKQIGRDVQFQFQIEDAQGQAAVHVEKVQDFKSQGISVFIGGLWSSQAGASDTYVNTNHMLMWSTSSTSPNLAIANDRLYRMCPSDSYTAPALVDVVWSYGIRHVVFIQRGDSWGDSIRNVFESAWKAKGGDFIGDTIRYEVEEPEFTSALYVADKQITDALAKGYKLEEIGGVLLSFNEAPVIVTQAKDYPNIYNIKWFGVDGTAKSQYIVDQSAEGANQMKIFSLLPSEQVNEQYTRLGSRYTALTKMPLGLRDAYLYDTSMIIMNAMLQADSWEADDIVNLMQPLCSSYYGVSGLCSLNEYGDRLPPPFDIWGYGVVDGKIGFVRYGSADPVTGSVTWDVSALGFMPSGSN